MLNFLLCVAQYVFIALVLLGIGGIGAFIGIKMRKSSNAKAAAAEAMENEEQILFGGYIHEEKYWRKRITQNVS